MKMTEINENFDIEEIDENDEIEDSEQRVRAYICTDFILDEEFWHELVKKEKLKYIIVGREVGKKTGRKHLQCYIHFISGKSFTKVRKLLGKRRIAVARGSAKANQKYCSKDNNLVVEWGEPPHQGKSSDTVKATKMITEGKSIREVAKTYPTAYVRNYRGLERLHEIINQNDEPGNWVKEVIVIIGPSGTGKTREAIEAGGVKLKIGGGFVLGYKNQEKVIFDEFDGTQMSKDLFLDLTDRYATVVNKKGYPDGIQWNPKTIYFCTQRDWKHWYTGDLTEVKRRITQIKYTGDFCTNENCTEVNGGNNSSVLPCGCVRLQ